MRLGMVIDLRKCIGCQGCSIVCKVENFTPQGVFWNEVVQKEIGIFPNVDKINLPRPCMHCEDPACLRVCPTGATMKRADGIVLVDDDICTGCRACVVACPYDARYYIGERSTYFAGHTTPYEAYGQDRHKVGTVSKCTFCYHRVDQGLQPACVSNCMARARYFGDLDDPNSEVSRLIRERHGQQLNPDAGTNPNVYYLLP